MSKRPRESDGERVLAHYNALQVHTHTQQERSTLPTFEVHSLHNWLKEQQYRLHVRRGDVLLEVCGGKGGDLSKVARAGARALVLVDLSEASVGEARRRASQLRGAFREHCEFVVGDVLTSDFWASRAVERAFVLSVRPKGARFEGVIRFSAIACQFALHYAFRSRESAELLFTEVASRLANNGIFFGIVANGDVIASKLAATAPLFELNESLYAIRLHANTDENKHVDIDETLLSGDFGGRYYFTLHDGSVVNVPEYVTRERVVRAVAEAAEFECIYYTPLNNFYMSLCRERPQECANSLAQRNLGRISTQNWDVARLYSAFAFRRRERPKH